MIRSSLLAWPIFSIVLLATYPLGAQRADDTNRAKLEQRDNLAKQGLEAAREEKFDDAIQLFEQVYAIEESIFGDAHDELLGSLDAIAHFARRNQDFEALVDARKRQFQVSERLYGKNDYRTQDAGRAVGAALQDAARSPEDRARLNQAGELHAEFIKCFNAGRFEQAIPFADQALAIRKIVLGEKHLDYATSLNNLATLHDLAGDDARAEPLYLQALEIRKTVLGEQHPGYAASLNSLAVFYFSKQDYAQAEPLYVQAMEIRKAVLGEQHPEYAASLHSLALLFDALGDYARAEPLHNRALGIRKNVLGEQHATYATSLDGLGAHYYSIGDYGRAESLYTQAIEIRKNVFGEQHPYYAESLDKLARVYESMGDFSRAESLYSQVQRIRATTLGDQHADYATSLNNLARLYGLMSDYGRAEPLYLQALEIRRAVTGEQNTSYADTLSNLATLYKSKGDYARAEPLYIQAAEIYKAVLGEQHPAYATNLHNLAMLYVLMGDHRRAVPLYTEVRAIYRAVHGEQHPAYATCLCNLGRAHESLQDFKRAEPLYVQAVEIFATMFGKQHPSYATGLSNLAGLYKSMGDNKRAERLYLEAMQIQSAAVGEQHPEYAACVNNLAVLYESSGDYVRAEPLYNQALEIRKNVLGEQHPDYANSLHNVAVIYDLMGEHSRAEPLFTQAIAQSLRHLDQTASILTERQQILMSQSLQPMLDKSIDCAMAMQPQPAAIADQLVAWKGSVLVRLRALRLAEDDPSISAAFQRLQDKTRQLSTLTSNVPGPDKLDAWHAKIGELTEEKESLDKQLMRDSAAFRSAQEKVSLDSLRQAIPSTGVILNFFQYGGKQGPSLMATIIRHDKEPVMVSLGSAVDAENGILRWRESFGASNQAKVAGQQLRKQLWEPLLPHIGDAKLIFVSTDGVLGQLPFAALPGNNKESYLLEDHAFVMLPVPSLLPQLMKRSTTGAPLQTALLMGEVDYDAAVDFSTPTPKSPITLMLTSNLTRSARGDTTYPALAGTGLEIDAIAELFRASPIAADQRLFELRDRHATESAFRTAVPSAQWLHLATHGFFASADKKNALSVTDTAHASSRVQLSSSSGSAQQSFAGFRPGQLSGLVFAGANQPPQPIDPLAPNNPGDDGILTADEIAYMQLEHVELAVLSACETGLGQTAGGEGILGLQRAFQVAGARTTVTSLWQVDDAATQALMVEFYRNMLERKLSKLESLRQAQLWLLHNPQAIEGRDLTTRGAPRPLKPISVDTKFATESPTRSLPVYWAAFQLSGDPR